MSNEEDGARLEKLKNTLQWELDQSSVTPLAAEVDLIVGSWRHLHHKAARARQVANATALKEAVLSQALATKAEELVRELRWMEGFLKDRELWKQYEEWREIQQYA